MNARWIFVVLPCVSTACGGDDSHGEGSGGAPSSGGSGGIPMSGSGGGAAAGMSGGAGNANGGTGGATSGTGGGGVAGAAGSASVTKGAVSLHIQGAPGCSLSDQYLDWPALPSGHPVTATEKGQALENGTTTPDGQPVKVICRWLAPQAPHTFQTQVQTGPAGTPRLVDLGAKIEPGKDVQGGVSLSSPALPLEGYASPATDPCVYNVISTDEATRSVWGRLHCGTVVSADGTDTCSLGDSYFFFENCTVPTP